MDRSNHGHPDITHMLGATTVHPPGDRDAVPFKPDYNLVDRNHRFRMGQFNDLQDITEVIPMSMGNQNHVNLWKRVPCNRARRVCHHPRVNQDPHPGRRFNQCRRVTKPRNPGPSAKYRCHIVFPTTIMPVCNDFPLRRPCAITDRAPGTVKRSVAP